MFKAILFLARKDVALHKLNSLCSLIYTCGADMVTAYRNAHSSSEMLACLTKVSLDGLLQSVHGSGYFSILIDESTDVSLSKQSIMYVRFITPTGPVTQFLCILELDDGSAVTIYKAVCDKLKVMNLDLKNLIGFGRMVRP